MSFLYLHWTRISMCCDVRLLITFDIIIYFLQVCWHSIWNSRLFCVCCCLLLPTVNKNRGCGAVYSTWKEHLDHQIQGWSGCSLVFISYTIYCTATPILVYCFHFCFHFIVFKLHFLFLGWWFYGKHFGKQVALLLNVLYKYICLAQCHFPEGQFRLYSSGGIILKRNIFHMNFWNQRNYRNLYVFILTAFCRHLVANNWTTSAPWLAQFAMCFSLVGW